MIVGIDPGKTGGVAFLAQGRKAFDLRAVEDMPPDADGLAELLRAWRGTVAFAVVEKVHAYSYFCKRTRTVRGQGASASFTFGQGFGRIEGVLSALSIRSYFIEPAVWKGSMNLGRNKGDSLFAAKIFFPAFEGSFARARDDGRAEAALIGLFGAERLK